MGLFYDIVMKQGQYEVSMNGEFYCVADDLIKAAIEVENYLEAEERAS